jgi:hypothetical protein
LVVLLGNAAEVLPEINRRGAGDADRDRFLEGPGRDSKGDP